MKSSFLFGLLCSTTDKPVKIHIACIDFILIFQFLSVFAKGKKVTFFCLSEPEVNLK